MAYNPNSHDGRIIRDGQIVKDEWMSVDDNAALPASGDIIVSLDRWQKDKREIVTRGPRYGIVLPNDFDVPELGEEWLILGAVLLQFPSFADGRAYSQATLLRERYGFEGELRATGDVLRDQLYYMKRVGINAFEIRSDRSIENALEALEDYSVHYQTATDHSSTIWQNRFAVSA